MGFHIAKTYHFFYISSIIILLKAYYTKSFFLRNSYVSEFLWSHSADALALIYSLFSHWCILIFWWQQNPWDNENGLRPNFCKMLFFKRDFLSHLSTLLHTERLFWIKIMPFKFTELSRLVLLQIFGAKETIVVCMYIIL